MSSNLTLTIDREHPEKLGYRAIELDTEAVIRELIFAGYSYSLEMDFIAWQYTYVLATLFNLLPDTQYLTRDLLQWIEHLMMQDIDKIEWEIRVIH